MNTSFQSDTETMSVNVTVNDNCSEPEYSVLVTFGTRPKGGDCNGERNASEERLSPGQTATFSVLTTSLSLGSGEEYCCIVILDGVPGKYPMFFMTLFSYSIPETIQIYTRCYYA